MNHCAKNMNSTLVSVDGRIGPVRRKSPATSASSGSPAISAAATGGRCRPLQVRSVELCQLVQSPSSEYGRGRGGMVDASAFSTVRLTSVRTAGIGRPDPATHDLVATD